MDLTKLLTLLGGATAVVIGVSVWLSSLVTNRLLSRWRRQESALLESLRAANAHTAMLLDAGMRGFGAGQDVTLQKRVSAAEELWRHVLDIRERFGRAVFFFGMLQPDEYSDALQNNTTIAASVADLTDESITAGLTASASLELQRPLLGETLWLRFFVYRAFLARLSHLIVEGKRRSRIPDWRTDDGVQQHLRHVLSEAEYKGIMQVQPGIVAVYRALNALEALLLSEISQIMSGRRSSAESFENARGLHSSLANIPPVTL